MPGLFNLLRAGAAPVDPLRWKYRKPSVAAVGSIRWISRIKSYLLEIKDGFAKQEFEAFLDRFIRDTYRVKGFVRLEGRLYLADCTSDREAAASWEMLPGEKEPEGINRVVILGEAGFPQPEASKKACSGLEDKIISFQ